MYGLKTAIRIETERDRQELIPFFEAIKSDCNRRYEEIDVFDYTYFVIGAIWFIDNEGELCEAVDEDERLLGYTILNGVPQGWREEMKLGYEIVHETKSDQLQKKINQLESENNKLREIISDYIDLSDLYCNISETNYSIQLENLTTQAKQLLK